MPKMPICQLAPPLQSRLWAHYLYFIAPPNKLAAAFRSQSTGERGIDRIHIVNPFDRITTISPY
jgi:hypothetical protein